MRGSIRIGLVNPQIADGPLMLFGLSKTEPDCDADYHGANGNNYDLQNDDLLELFFGIFLPGIFQGITITLIPVGCVWKNIKAKGLLSPCPWI